MPIPPTAGVVTFNLKQAELIDDALQRRASRDRAFKTALEREQVRTSDGEDVSFFVRNLENVQGDERDLIVFSTTFGKDAPAASSEASEFSLNRVASVVST